MTLWYTPNQIWTGRVNRSGADFFTVSMCVCHFSCSRADVRIDRGILPQAGIVMHVVRPVPGGQDIFPTHAHRSS